jgi:hypothetical protein
VCYGRLGNVWDLLGKVITPNFWMRLFGMYLKVIEKCSASKTHSLKNAQLKKCTA